MWHLPFPKTIHVRFSLQKWGHSSHVYSAIPSGHKNIHVCTSPYYPKDYIAFYWHKIFYSTHLLWKNTSIVSDNLVLLPKFYI